MTTTPMAVPLLLGLLLLLAPSFPSPVIAQTTPVYQPRVLFIGIDPTDQSGRSLANTYYSWNMGNKLAAQFERDLALQTIQDFTDLSAGRIQYQLADHIRFTDFPVYPDGFSFTVDSYAACVWGTPQFNPTACEERKQQFPYETYLNQKQLCEKAQESNADEIWIVSPSYVLAWEAFMVGPNPGYWVNGPSYTLNSCSKHYVVVNATYDRGEQLLHSYGHRVETTINYLIRNWRLEDRTNYWTRFFGGYPPMSNSVYCGNAHYPHNTVQAYEYGDVTNKASSCADLANFPTYSGTQSSYNCTTWGCTDRGWQKHWLSFIPHTLGTIEITDAQNKTYEFKKDWWYYILYPEHTLSSENGIFPSPSTISASPADANSDGVVNVEDFHIWITNFGKTISGKQSGDFDANGKANLLDFVVWIVERT